MATTPEGKIKAKVSKLLKETPCLYYYMPVPGGYGGTTLDYVGCHMGVFFAVETKAPGKKPTSRQQTIIEAMTAAGGRVFVIDGDAGVEKLAHWLDLEGHLDRLPDVPPPAKPAENIFMDGSF